MLLLTNKAEQSQDTAKDFDDEDADEQVWIRCIRESGRGASDADADAAKKVAQPNSQTAPENSVSYVNVG